LHFSDDQENLRLAGSFEQQDQLREYQVHVQPRWSQQDSEFCHHEKPKSIINKILEIMSSGEVMQCSTSQSYGFPFSIKRCQKPNNELVGLPKLSL